MNKNFSLLSLLLIVLWCLPSQAQLGFCNGNSGDPIFTEDFGSGTTAGPALPPGTTSYSFVAGTPTDGSYTISSSTAYYDWHDTPDRTPNDVNGKSFIVNADFTAGEFFRRTVDGLCENTSYEFSSWLINLLPISGCEGIGIPINVKFQIWDNTDTNLLANGDTGSIQGTASPQWRQYGLVFQTLPGQTSVILKMLNNGEGGCGNDLAIDDIVFKSCGDFIDIIDTENNTYLLLCEDDGPVTTTLNANPDFSIYSTHAYQWQQSPDGINWVDIPGATNNTLDVVNLNTSRFYRAKVAEDPINLSNPQCIAISEVFDIIFIPIPDAPQTPITNISLCPNENQRISVTVPTGVNVNWYDGEIGGNLLLENSISFEPLTPGTYYAEAVTIAAQCRSYARTAINVSFYSVPELSDENLTFCEGTSQLLSVEADNMMYQWNTGETTQEINVTTPGLYSAIVTTPDGCQRTKMITLEQIELPIIDRIWSEEYTITITTENSGNFDYSLDGTNFTDSPVFENIPGGRYTIFVRERGGCGIVTREFIHLVIPKFFTPNGDYSNDVFQAEGFEFLDAYEIRIYTRYGQLLSLTKNEPMSWDGTYKGSPLPSSDYWYSIIMDGIELKGHFALKR